MAAYPKEFRPHSTQTLRNVTSMDSIGGRGVNNWTPERRGKFMKWLEATQ